MGSRERQSGCCAGVGSHHSGVGWTHLKLHPHSNYLPTVHEMGEPNFSMWKPYLPGIYSHCCSVCTGVLIATLLSTTPRVSGTIPITNSPIPLYTRRTLRGPSRHVYWHCIIYCHCSWLVVRCDLSLFALSCSRAGWVRHLREWVEPTSRPHPQPQRLSSLFAGMMFGKPRLSTNNSLFTPHTDWLFRLTKYSVSRCFVRKPE